MNSIDSFPKFHCVHQCRHRTFSPSPSPPPPPPISSSSPPPQTRLNLLLPPPPPETNPLQIIGFPNADSYANSSKRTTNSDRLSDFRHWRGTGIWRGTRGGGAISAPPIVKCYIRMVRTGRICFGENWSTGRRRKWWNRGPERINFTIWIEMHVKLDKFAAIIRRLFGRNRSDWAVSELIAIMENCLWFASTIRRGITSMRNRFEVSGSNRRRARLRSRRNFLFRMRFAGCNFHGVTYGYF